MTVEPSGTPNVVRIRVEKDEVMCDGGKPLPYATWIGTINTETGKVNVWMPAAYTPRGYRAAAQRILEERAAIILDGK